VASDAGVAATGPVSPTAATVVGRARRDDLPQHPASVPRGTASGGGIYTKGFRAHADTGVVTANTPDDCVGCF
jgi:hypothetical protein